MKGYILALSMVLLFSGLFVFVNHSLEYKRLDRQINFETFFVEKMAYMLDDIREDIRRVLSVDIPAGTVEMTIIDRFAVNNIVIDKSEFFTDYKEFIVNFSTNSNTAIGFNFSDPVEINFSNEFLYKSNYTDLNNQRVDFYNSSGGSAAVDAYRIIIFSNNSEARSRVVDPEFTVNGTLIVIDYTDIRIPAKDFITSGFIDPTILNTMIIQIGNTNEYINLSFGLINGRENSFSMEQVSVTSAPNLTLIINRTTQEPLYAHYNLPLNISVSNVNFSGFVPAS